jgi:hypothetical protein
MVLRLHLVCYLLTFQEKMVDNMPIDESDDGS